MGEFRKPDPDPSECRPWDQECKGRDAVGKVTVGLMVIWLGCTLLFHDSLDPWWGYLLSGFGVIFILESLVRMSRPQFRAPVGGKLVGGIILIILGGLFISGVSRWWPLILIAIGAVFVIQGIRGARRT
jgi:hypothetical protein